MSMIRNIARLFKKIKTALFSGEVVGKNEGYSNTGRGVGISITGTLDTPFRRLIEIGDHVTIANGHILTHDAMGNNHDGMIKVGKVVIGDHVSIGWSTVILPGVRIGRGSIIAANSLVLSGTDVPDGEVWGGNPARFICTVKEYLDKRERDWNGSKLRRKQIDGCLQNLASLELILLRDESCYAIRRKDYEVDY